MLPTEVGPPRIRTFCPAETLAQSTVIWYAVVPTRATAAPWSKLAFERSLLSLETGIEMYSATTPPAGSLDQHACEIPSSPQTLCHRRKTCLQYPPPSGCCRFQPTLLSMYLAGTCEFLFILYPRNHRLPSVCFSSLLRLRTLCFSSMDARLCQQPEG
jgi:hypothetical protein